MNHAEHRGPGIPGSVAHCDEIDDIIEWIHERGFVDEDETVVDVQMSTDPTGVLRLDDITTEADQ